MSLTERDELDLAGLASGFGNAKSDARARRLIETVPEAVKFVRQIRSICNALRAHAEAGLPPLSGEEKHTIPAAILARVKQRPFVAGSVVRRRWQWGAVAAVVAISVGVWFTFSQRLQPVLAEAVFDSKAMSLNPARTSGPRRAQIRAGQLVETRLEYAVLRLSDDTRVVAEFDTSFTLQGTGRTIDLRQGVLFIRAASTMQVNAPNLVLRVEEPGSLVMLRMTPGNQTCRVYAGRARLTRQGRDTQFRAGQLAAWDEATSDVQVELLSVEPPQWVTNAFRQVEPGHDIW